MSTRKITKYVLIVAIATSLSACGISNIFGGDSKEPGETDANATSRDSGKAAKANEVEKRETIFDLFDNSDDPNITMRVNKYLWNASLEVLSFMPVQRADPFTGTISLGYGRAQGSKRQYRATIQITDPALDARSLRVALQGSGGSAVDAKTVRAIEDAILTRARQLRIADTNL